MINGYPHFWYRYPVRTLFLDFFLFNQFLLYNDPDGHIIPELERQSITKIIYLFTGCFLQNRKKPDKRMKNTPRLSRRGQYNENYFLEKSPQIEILVSLKPQYSASSPE